MSGLTAPRCNHPVGVYDHREDGVKVTENCWGCSEPGWEMKKEVTCWFCCSELSIYKKQKQYVTAES